MLISQRPVSFWFSSQLRGVPSPLPLATLRVFTTYIGLQPSRLNSLHDHRPVTATRRSSTPSLISGCAARGSLQRPSASKGQSFQWSPVRPSIPIIQIHLSHQGLPVVSQPAPDLASLFCWFRGQHPELLHSTPLKEFFKSPLCISIPSHESCIWMPILSTTLANCDRRSLILPNQRVHFIWVQTTPVHDEGDALMKPTVSHRPQKIQIRLFSHFSKSTKHTYTGGSACHDTPEVLQRVTIWLKVQ